MFIFKLLIKEYREQKKISQYKLAKAAGISRSYLNEIEAGLKIPRLPMLEKIAKALKVRMGDLIQDDIEYIESIETDSITE